MSVPGKDPHDDARGGAKTPSLTCAICKGRYRPITIPGMHTIYSICPDCRLDAPPDPAEPD